MGRIAGGRGERRRAHGTIRRIQFPPPSENMFLAKLNSGD
jgi:hypothetical protein